MFDVTAKVTEALSNALTLAGLSKEDSARVMNGAQIYGDNGLLDSVGLVRLIGGVSLGFEDLGVDMFDMLEMLDENPAEVFTDKASIIEFTSRALSEVLLEQQA
ncbi:MAG: hypothetical protein ACSHXB_16110 [Sulfitobacter sp.]